MTALQALASALIQRCVVLVGFGAILVSISEFWFYELEAEVDSIAIVLVYGLLGYVFLAMMRRMKTRSVAGFIVASALLGFLIEGVVVPVVYAMPPFSIMWTSLAWHGLITVGIGWVGVRHVLSVRPKWVAALWLSGFGLFLGAWNAFLWNANEAPGSSEINWVWQPVPLFAEQFLFGYALFLGGHLVFNRFSLSGLQVNRGEYAALWAVCGVASLLTGAASGLWVFYPILPALVALCLYALSRDRAEGDLVVDRIHAEPIPPMSFALTALIPLTAIPVYTAMHAAELRLEMNVLVIVTAGPVSVALFGWALFQLLKR